MYQARVKLGHPTGVYRRCGMTFTVSADMPLAGLDDKQIEVIKNDRWLVVTEIAEQSEQPAKAGRRGAPKAEPAPGSQD